MNPLREPLSPEQMTLLRVLYKPFDEQGQWPFWHYADVTLDAIGIDAAAILRSLPVAGSEGVSSRNYRLIFHSDSDRDPSTDTEVALTIAGLRHLPEAEPLASAFLDTFRYLIGQERAVIPHPRKVVEAVVMSTALAAHLSGPESDFSHEAAESLARLRQMLAHEPPLYGCVQSHPDRQWSVRVPARLRAYRDIATIDDYLDRVAEYVTPRAPAAPPTALGPLDLANAIGYLDAVWKNRTGSPLFINLDPASIARLTQPCTDDGDFDSLMSALADVLAQAVVPGHPRPPRREALEKIRGHLQQALDSEAAARTSDAIGTLITLRRIRVGGQHSDARAKAVDAFREIGLAFPPYSWEQAWTRIAWLAKGALDAIREEVHAGLSQQ